MYTRGNTSGLFDGFGSSGSDLPARVFRTLGIGGFALVPVGMALSDKYPDVGLWLWLSFIGFFMGPVMFIFYAARVVGMNQSIKGFGRQLWHVFRKAILYLLLPAAAFTLLMILYAHFVTHTV